MSWNEYVELMADLLSGDAKKMGDANRMLFGKLVTGPDADKHPALALVDAEQAAQGT